MLLSISGVSLNLVSKFKKKFKPFWGESDFVIKIPLRIMYLNH